MRHAFHKTRVFFQVERFFKLKKIEFYKVQPLSKITYLLRISDENVATSDSSYRMELDHWSQHADPSSLCLRRLKRTELLFAACKFFRILENSLFGEIIHQSTPELNNHIFITRYRL